MEDSVPPHIHLQQPVLKAKGLHPLASPFKAKIPPGKEVVVFHTFFLYPLTFDIGPKGGCPIIRAALRKGP